MGELSILLESTTLRFLFKKKKLVDLYEKEEGRHKYPVEVISGFFFVMTVISAARDIRDLYALKSFHFEKLAGKRKDERSVRLNDQWRLLMTLQQDELGNYLLIIDIEDYHGRKK